GPSAFGVACRGAASVNWTRTPLAGGPPMRSSTRWIATLTVTLLALVVLSRTSRAGWIGDGNPICTAPAPQHLLTSAADGSGGVSLVWLGQRRGSTFSGLCATRLLADGTIAAGWPVDGAALSQTGHVGTPSAAPDGAGGLLVFWLDQGANQARMQRID